MPKNSPFIAKNRIRDVRKSRKLVLQNLADSIESTPTEISRIERGERELRLDWLEKLSVPLNCLPADLLLLEHGGLDDDERSIVDAYRNSPESVRAAFRAIAESQLGAA